MQTYVTSVSNDQYIPGVIALAKSLRFVKATRPLLVMYTASVTKIHEVEALGVECLEIQPPELSDEFLKRHMTEKIHTKPFKGIKPSFHNTLHNFDKLRGWQLSQYRKAIYLDADVVAIRNIDQLFNLPEFAAAPNLYTSIVDLNRMNAGVFVFTPSENTYDQMISCLNIPGAFYERTDQTFLQSYFPNWHQIPYLYNTLQYLYFNIPEIWLWEKIKVIHYQYEKPWDVNHPKKELLKDVHEVWHYLYDKGKLPDFFLEDLQNRNHSAL